MNADLAQRLARAFTVRFPEAPRAWRRIGREGEHPVVHPDGTAADIAVLWRHLADGTAADVLRERDLVVGLELDDVTYSAEVGRGTIEVIVGPCDDLHGIRGRYERAMARLVRAADAERLIVLGYGIQPATPGSLSLMTAKQRYRVLYEVLGEAWLWFSATASDQTHVDVSREEVMEATNLSNLLSGVTIALCGNSPIHGGEDQGVCSGREAGMGTIHAEGFRHGLPGGPSPDIADWVRRSLDLDYLMHRDGLDNHPVGVPFARWAAARDLDDDALFQAWLHHDHYIWNSARPRTAHATVELRSPGQQPWPDHMAAAALAVGMVSAHKTLAARVEATFGERAWDTLRAYHGAAIRDGLAAEEPAEGFLAGVLDDCAQALATRGRGEEAYLAPLRQRLADRRNPAQQARQVFAEGGLAALVEHARIRL